MTLDGNGIKVNTYATSKNNKLTIRGDSNLADIAGTGLNASGTGLGVTGDVNALRTTAASTAATVTMTGYFNHVTDSGTNSQVTMNSGRATVSGADNKVTVTGGGEVTVSGSRDTVSMSDSGNATVDVSGSDNTVNLVDVSTDLSTVGGINIAGSGNRVSFNYGGDSVGLEIDAKSFNNTVDVGFGDRANLFVHSCSRTLFVAEDFRDSRPVYYGFSDAVISLPSRQNEETGG